ncbi:synaptonemal complex protein 3-like [Choloepus didactylus]|uniref:synaptonemal complex protein 3-like n=1 Tax=Choloepus didactylus TaxID=27675 RepID=UPI00189D38B7|nr:synaptonemal complex protein 3-like [Choloepus didactylus]
MAPFGRKRLRKSGRPSEEEEVVPGAPDCRRGERRDLSGAEEDGMEGKTPVTDRHGKKRPSARTIEEEVGGEVHSMLEKLGDDITKSLLAKRKRFEMNTNASLNTSNQKFEHVWKAQHEQRKNLNYDYSQQFSTLFQQWDKDLQKAGEQEEKLHDMFRQQQKVFQQYRIIQNQRVKAIRKLYEQFLKGIEDLEKDHENHLTEAQRELKEEMALLQKKMLMETQRQEVAAVRKSLQSLLL